MVVAAVRDNTYNVVLLLHIAAVLVTFAPAVVNPLLGARYKDDPSGTRVLGGHSAANTRQIHLPALLVTGVLGIVLLVMSEDVFEFSQTWVSLSFLVWIAIGGVVSAVILPNEKRVGAGDLDAVKKLETGGMIASLLLVVMLYLMIFKPGF